MAYNQNYSQRSNDPVRFDLMEHIGVLTKKDNGWTKEVNIVAWNGGKAKVDIREWDPEHSRMTKGITLFEEEAETLVRALARRYGLRYTGNAPRPEADPAPAAMRAAPATAEPSAAAMEGPFGTAPVMGEPVWTDTEERAAEAMEEPEAELPFDGAAGEQS